MSNFESLIFSAPYGFMNGCKSLSELPEGEFKRCVLAGIADDSPCAPNLAFNAVRVVKHIFRAYQQSQPKPASVAAIASTLEAYTVLSGDCIQRLLTIMDEFSDAALPSQATRRNRILNFRWQLGVALAQRSGRTDGSIRLDRPYVSICFDVMGSDGTLLSQSAELSIPQFQEFKSVFEKVASQMDNV